MKNRKVVIVTNVPSPYRIPLFNELHSQLLFEGVELKVLFGSDHYSRRKFKLNLAECSFSYEFLDSGKYNFGDQEKTYFTYKGLMSALKVEKPDCIIMSGFSLGATRLWWYSLFNKVNYIIWTGSINHKDKNNSLMRRIQRKLIASRASAFIAYGSLAKKYLMSLGLPEQKIHIATNTVDTAFFSTETNALRKVLAPQERVHLTYIGYLSPRKNVIRVLEVVKELSKVRTDFVLDIIGDGTDKPILEKFVQMNGLAEFVRFHGFRQKAELPAFMAKSSGFLFQTDFDIWGLVLNEAMAAGLPCITSLHAGASVDLIRDGENGFIVDYSDKKKVIEKINLILDHPEESKRMGQKAKEFIVKEASIQVSASGFVKAILMSLSP
jgi:glycosyltransferase involved in cell wall biosynthesis